MAKICVVASRKGGVGKSTIAYEISTLLEGVLLDLEWDGGGVTTTWGYRSADRATDALMNALQNERTPRPVHGFRKPALVPGSPDLVDANLSPEQWADRIEHWAGEWDTEWVVIDTHPGASAPAHGAMAVANVVLSPTGLRTSDLNGAEQLVREMADYPLSLVPNMVPRIPPAPELNRLAHIIQGTPVRVAPPIPYAPKIGTRKRRMAMSAEDPTPKALQGVVSAFNLLADYVKEYQ